MFNCSEKNSRRTCPDYININTLETFYSVRACMDSNPIEGQGFKRNNICSPRVCKPCVFFLKKVDKYGTRMKKSFL